MGVDSILQRIRDEGRRQCEAISGEAAAKASAILSEGKGAAAELYRRLLDEELQRIEQQRQKKLIDVRLESRRELLLAKQEMIGRLFTQLKSTLKKGRFKKQQVSQSKVEEIEEDADFYLAKLRQENETEIAEILFL